MEIIVVDDREYEVRIESEVDLILPWKWHDRDSLVSEWESRDKRPGELVLAKIDSRRMFFDLSAAIALAKKHDLILPSKALHNLTENLGRSPTKNEEAAEAANHYFNRLKAWLNEEWHYCTVIVEDANTGDFESLGMIPSDDDAGIDAAAKQLAEKLHLQFKQENRFTDAMANGI